MNFAIHKDGGTGQVSISKSYMLTWNGPNAMKENNFHPASWWAQRGFQDLILCGKGWDANHSACIPFSFSFAGVPTRVVMRLRIMVTNSRSRTFRWGFTDQRADSLFLGRGDVNSPLVYSQGIFTPEYNGGTNWQEFDLWAVNVPQSGYLYLWRTSNSYGNIHVEGATLEVFTESSSTVWKTATPYIYDNGWKGATAYIYDNGWKGA